MILDIILVLLLLGVLGGLGVGYRSGQVMPASPAGIVLAVVVVALIVGLLAPHFWAPHPVAVPP